MAPGEARMNLRQRTWEVVEAAKPGDQASRVFDVAILTLIFLNVLAGVFGTVPRIELEYDALLSWFETISVAVFSVEYIARLWACSSDKRFAEPLRGRLRFALRPLPLIDLLAIVPFYLPFLSIDLRSFRVLRLLRILRVAKVARYTTSLQLIKRVVYAKKEELVLTSAFMVLLLVMSASVLYYCENPHQPEVFSSIPATKWWAIATLTTVGYGDMYPVTVLGKIFGSIIAILGIGMFALPTGILGAGFVEELQRSKQPDQRCPHCGLPIHQHYIEK